MNEKEIDTFLQFTLCGRAFSAYLLDRESKTEAQAATFGGVAYKHA